MNAPLPDAVGVVERLLKRRTILRMDAVRTIQSQAARIAELEGSLSALVKGWDVVAPHVDNIFMIQRARTGIGYQGPRDFAEALSEARSLLSEGEGE